MTHHEEFADLYLRLSLDRQGKTAIERQEADCREWAARNGLQVRHVHVDRGRSGYKNVTRAGFEEALSAATSGVVGTLIVWKLDRLSRRGMGQVGDALDRLDAVGARLVSVEDGLDTSRPEARMVVALLSEVARSESANIGTRVASAKAHLRTLGRWIGGQPPFGLRLASAGVLEPDPKTGPIAREIADRVLAGESVIGVVTDLNKRGVASARGGTWTVGSATQLLRGPAFAGLLPETEKDGRGSYTARVYPWRDPETGETVSIGEGIVTPAEQRKIAETIDARATADSWGRRRGVRSESRHLLTGLLRCDSCGARMSGQARSYVCQSARLGRGCPRTTRGYVPAVDHGVTEAWVRRLTAAEPGDPLLEAVAERWVRQHDPEAVANRRTISAEVETTEASIADLEDSRYLRGEFSGEAGLARYARLHERLEARLAGLRRDLERHTLPDADISPLLDPVLVRQAWQEASVKERRGLLRLALDCVRVKPSPGGRGYRFDPETRLRFVWAVPGAETSPECSGPAEANT
jgi:site-specific DNA recombinase